MISFFSKNKTKLIFFFFAFAALVLGHLLAEKVAHLIDEGIHHLASSSGGIFIGYVLLVGLFFVALEKAHEHGSDLQGVRALHVTRNRSAKVMVFSVSKMDDKDFLRLEELVKEGRCTWTSDKGQVEVVRSNSLAEDIKRAAPYAGYRLNTFQALRGVEHSLDELQTVHLIPSKDSQRVALLLKTWLQSYKSTLHVEMHKPIDAEDIEALHSVFEKITHEEVSKKISVDDIIIDVTAGTKTVSIAGAMATVKSRVRNQYVPNDWAKKPILINLVNEAARHGAH